MKRWITLALLLVAVSSVILPAYTLACTTYRSAAEYDADCFYCQDNGLAIGGLGPDWIVKTVYCKNGPDCGEFSGLEWEEVENYCGFYPWCH